MFRQMDPLSLLQISSINESVLQDFMRNLLEVLVSCESVKKDIKKMMISGGVSQLTGSCQS
jgi:hypothetical protein